MPRTIKRALYREYTNPCHRRDPYDDNYGWIAADGMAAIAFRLYHRGVPAQDAIPLLMVEARRRGVLDAVHMIKHGTSGGSVYLIPEGATNRQIIEMIARAST